VHEYPYYIGVKSKNDTEVTCRHESKLCQTVEPNTQQVVLKESAICLSWAEVCFCAWVHLHPYVTDTQSELC